MHDILNDKLSLISPFNLKLGNGPSCRGGLQFETPGVKYSVGKESAQYRRPVIWNFITRLVNLMQTFKKTVLRTFYAGSHGKGEQ